MALVSVCYKISGKGNRHYYDQKLRVEGTITNSSYKYEDLDDEFRANLLAKLSDINGVQWHKIRLLSLYNDEYVSSTVDIRDYVEGLQRLNARARGFLAALLPQVPSTTPFSEICEIAGKLAVMVVKKELQLNCSNSTTYSFDNYTYIPT